jgi:hypothetical protein
MTASPTVTLFSQEIDSSRPPASFLASILIHCGVIALLWFGIAYTPRIDARTNKERYTVRKLDLRTPEQQMRGSAKGAARYPGPQLAASNSAPGKSNPHPPVMRQITHAQPGPQTLIQPDLPDSLTLIQPVPVPLVVLWSPSKTPVKDIVAPLPAKPTASDVKPSLERPNEEVNLADDDLSAAKIPSVKLPLMAGTTSPVVVHGPELTQLAPQTAAQNSAQPTPATVMSLSDLQMKDGSITLPPVNETALTTAPGELAPGDARNSATPDRNGAGKAGGTGAEQNTGSTVAAPATIPNASAHEGQRNGANSSPSAPGSDAGNDQSGQASATPITLPRNGRFGAVVVGNAVEDQFPEMAGVWNGRMAYTVYLHVGLARSWIMQYSLPRSADAEAAGNTMHLEAPWPYSIVRPNLDAGAIDADALMVHGFVNQSGRFETLSIVFPQSFSQAQFVLSSLQQWQFRPAMQNGQGARVEVLLIIPEELE